MKLSTPKIPDFVHDPCAVSEGSPAVFSVPFDVSDILGCFRSLGVTSLYPGCSIRASKVDQKVVYNTENSGFWIPALKIPDFVHDPCAVLECPPIVEMCSPYQI